MSLENAYLGDRVESHDCAPEADAVFFRQHGFCAIRNLISNEMIEHLKRVIAGTANGTTFDTIKKNTYNTAIDDPAIHGFLGQRTFAALIGSLGYRDSVFTDGVIFETDAELGASTGISTSPVSNISFRRIEPSPSGSPWIRSILTSRMAD
ncbi:hypothetical protein [Burkholderia gladioli]|uniref:hypothetical protein n=1 Tax=Burkholderia gladioli TaxID=28095 RepID=UPI001640A9E5|nr:hypothetical protein [Burkholderia gladioli]